MSQEVSFSLARLEDTPPKIVFPKKLDPERRKKVAEEKQHIRRLRLCGLLAQGYTQSEAAKQLGVSRKTVERDLKSGDPDAFRDALMQRQLAEIEMIPLDDVESIEKRLKWRSDAIKNIPTRGAVDAKGGDGLDITISEKVAPRVAAS